MTLVLKSRVNQQKSLFATQDDEYFYHQVKAFLFLFPSHWKFSDILNLEIYDTDSDSFVNDVITGQETTAHLSSVPPHDTRIANATAVVLPNLLQQGWIGKGTQTNTSFALASRIFPFVLREHFLYKTLLQ